jgi:hypothetical protein
VYSAANICIHFFTFEFLDRVVSAKEKFLHHHVAKKKIPYVNEAGAWQLVHKLAGALRMALYALVQGAFCAGNSLSTAPGIV